MDRWKQIATIDENMCNLIYDTLLQLNDKHIIESATALSETVVILVNKHELILLSNTQFKRVNSLILVKTKQHNGRFFY